MGSDFFFFMRQFSEKNGDKLHFCLFSKWTMVSSPLSRTMGIWYNSWCFVKTCTSVLKSSPLPGLPTYVFTCMSIASLNHKVSSQCRWTQHSSDFVLLHSISPCPRTAWGLSDALSGCPIALPHCPPRCSPYPKGLLMPFLAFHPFQRHRLAIPFAVSAPPVPSCNIVFSLGKFKSWCWAAAHQKRLLPAASSFTLPYFSTTLV